MRKQLLALAAVAAVAVGACSGGSSGSAKPSVPTSLGDGEGALNLVAWSGYVVGGTGGEQVQGYDWVTPFEQETGCKVNVKVGVDSANMVQLMKTGEYDGVSASGDATLRLIAGGDVAPVNFDLIPNYKDVFTGLKNQPYNTVGGVGYGVPHGRGANLLMYNPDVVTTAPDSWSVVFDADSPYKGKVTAYNYAIYIADAALYLMATKPDLGIKNPYSLDDKQLAAAVDLLKQQKGLVSRYWGTSTDEIQGFEGGDMNIGTAWQYQANVINSDGKIKVETTKPKEGATGLVRHVDDLVEGQAPELHVQVDELHHLAQGERGRDGVLRRGAGQRRGVRRGREAEPRPLRAVPRQRRGLLQGRLVLEHADDDLPRRADRRQVHGLRRLDQGLDRDHGRLTAPS